MRRITARVNCSLRESGEATRMSPRGHATYLEGKPEEDTEPVAEAEHRGNRLTRGGSARPDRYGKDWVRRLTA